MIAIVIRWLVLTAGITLAAYLIDGIWVEGFFSALFAAAILGILNLLFRPFVLILTLPINILTLGLFTFVINALMLKMASGVISGFRVYGFWSAILGSLVISLISWLVNSFIHQQRGETYIDLEKRHDDRWE